MAQRRSNRARNPEPTPHVDLEYPSSVPTFTVNPTPLSSSASSSSTQAPTPWFSAFGRTSDGDPLPPECDPKYSDPAYYATSNYGKGHRNTSHTAKKPEGHIKRPPNCFLLFRSHVKETGIRIPDELRPILKDRLRERKREVRAKRGEDADAEDDDDDDDDDQDDDEQSVSKISGILWDFLPAAEKSIFRARAAHAKAQHKKFYPTYKYSPQVKDKSVKKRVGKKMAPEKRERLEEAASILAANLGWVQPDSEGSSKPKTKREKGSPTESSTPATSTPPVTTPGYPGSSAFPVSAYSHQQPQSAYFPGQQYPPTMVVRDDGSGTMNPHIRGAHAVNGVHDTTHLPMGPPPAPQVMSAVEPGAWGSTGLGMGIGTALRNANAAAAASATPSEQVPGGARMYRRTSSCPPPGAHLTWDTLQQASSSSTPTHPWSQQPQQHYSQPQQISQIPSQQPALLGEHTFVRPGGKTARKMRSGNTVKANVLGGQQNSANEMKNSKRRRSPPRSATTSSTPNMTLPSVPNVRPTSARSDLAMPMTALSYDSQSESGMWAAQSNYEFPPSVTSSPTTFDSSAPPSVILETPPFGHQHTQLQIPAYSYQQQQYSFPNMAEQYYGHNDAYTGINEAYAPVGGKPAADGQLGLTVIDDGYQFPPAQPSSGYESSDQERTPRSNTLPVEPLASPRRKAGHNWARPERPSPLSSSHPPASQSPAVPSPRTASPHATTVIPPPTIISPSPVTPIQIAMQQQQAEYHHHSQGLDQLGVDINLNVAPGSLDPESLAGLLEFSFPHSYAHGGLPQDGYAMALPPNGYVDAGYAHAQQQQVYPSGPDASLGPLDIPLHELYSSYPPEGTAPHTAQFDPSTYIADPLAEGTMTSAEALEFDMMEWRRNSGSNNQNGQESEDADENASAISAATVVAPGRGYNGSRRASVQLGNTFGGEIAMALYGFDAAQQQQVQGQYAMSLGMEFEFQQGPPPSASEYSPSYTAVGTSPGSYAPAPNMHYPPLGTVAEERERSPSVEA